MCRSVIKAVHFRCAVLVTAHFVILGDLQNEKKNIEFKFSVYKISEDLSMVKKDCTTKTILKNGQSSKRTYIIFLTIALILLSFLNGCSTGTNENEQSKVEELKTYLTDHLNYQLKDLRVVLDTEVEKYVVVATLGTDYGLEDFVPFAEDLVDTCKTIEEQYGISIAYINPVLYTSENTWIGWSNDSGSFYNQDKFLAENVSIEELGAKIEKLQQSNKNDMDIEEKFGDMLNAFQGEWKSTKSNWHLIICNDNIDALYYENYGDEVDEANHNKYKFDLDENGNLIVTQSAKHKYNYVLDENGYLISTSVTNSTNTYEKISDNTTLPTIIKKSKPTIGMTQSEVYASTWGTPKKRNKTTTANGEREQWVYDEGYIYFENGIVTTIQEK